MERLFRAVIEEANGPATGGRIVHYLRYEDIVVFFVAEVQFVAYPDFPGRIHQDVPETGVCVEFAEQEDLDFSAGLFLSSVQTGWEYLGIVEDHDIPFVEIAQDIFEDLVFDFTRFTVDDHHTGMVSVFSGVLRDKFFWELKIKLRELGSHQHEGFFKK